MNRVNFISIREQRESYRPCRTNPFRLIGRCIQPAVAIQSQSSSLTTQPLFPLLNSDNTRHLSLLCFGLFTGL